MKEMKSSKLHRTAVTGVISVFFMASVAHAQPGNDLERPLVASAGTSQGTGAKAPLSDTKKIEPAPIEKNEPVTTSSETSWGVYAGVGAAAVAVVAVAAGGGSSSGGSGGGSSSGACAGWATSGNQAVYYFDDPVRIGDDQNYNDYHDDQFQISSPTGRNYNASFELPSTCTYSSAHIKYIIAACIYPAKVYINGNSVGRTCNPGNTAYARRECDPINVTNALQPGANTLRIETSLYPGDTVSPYDDIEIYDLRIELQR